MPPRTAPFGGPCVTVRLKTDARQETCGAVEPLSRCHGENDILRGPGRGHDRQLRPVVGDSDLGRMGRRHRHVRRGRRRPPRPCSVALTSAPAQSSGRSLSPRTGTPPSTPPARCDGAPRTSRATAGSPPSHPEKHRQPAACRSLGCEVRRVRRVGSRPCEAEKLRKAAACKPVECDAWVRTANPESRPVASELSGCAPRISIRQVRTQTILIRSPEFQLMRHRILLR
jgi:hypothetical protein